MATLWSLLTMMMTLTCLPSPEKAPLKKAGKCEWFKATNIQALAITNQPLCSSYLPFICFSHSIIERGNFYETLGNSDC